MNERIARIERNTKETQISVSVNLDGSGEGRFASGLPFLDHMLDQVARHGLIDLDVEANGDLEIDAHHTVEDIGITLGQALAKAWGDKRGLRRYGHAYVPLDEALSRVVVDLSGRPGLEYEVSFPRARIGDFDVDLFREFFQGVVNHAGMTLHIDNLKGRNAHHIIETVYKAFGRALRMAVEMTSDPAIKLSKAEAVARVTTGTADRGLRAEIDALGPLGAAEAHVMELLHLDSRCEWWELAYDADGAAMEHDHDMVMPSE